MVHVLIILCHKNEKLYATKSFLIVLTDICPSLNLVAMKLHIFILTSLLSRNFLFKKKLFKWKDLMMFVYSSRDFDGDDDDGFDSVNKVERWEEWDDNRISSWCHWRAKAVENSLQICNVSFFFLTVWKNQILLKMKLWKLKMKRRLQLYEMFLNHENIFVLMITVTQNGCQWQSSNFHGNRIFLYQFYFCIELNYRALHVTRLCTYRIFNEHL